MLRKIEIKQIDKNEIMLKDMTNISEKEAKELVQTKQNNGRKCKKCDCTEFDNIVQKLKEKKGVLNTNL